VKRLASVPRLDSLKKKKKTENTFKANGALVGPFVGVIHDVNVKLLPVVIVIKLILFVT
jgi:hypothetical protein